MTNPGPVNLKSGASTNATSVSSVPSRLRGYACYNNAAYAVFLKFYDKSTAPTVGTDTPAFKVAVPAGGQAISPDFGRGVTFANGIGYAITKLVADSDTTVVVADDLNGTLVWELP